MSTTPFTNLFKAAGFSSKTVDVPSTECPDEKASPYLPKTKRPMPMVDSFVTALGIRCHDETGKPWLVSETACWDKVKCAWVCVTEGVMAMPMLIKASSSVEDSVHMPSFDGFLEVCVSSEDELVKLYGKDPVPTDMIGCILCIGDSMPCYMGDKPIKAEVQCGGDQPAADSGVKIWIDGTTQKSPSEANPNLWVELD